jgi:hypothetical protein
VGAIAAAGGGDVEGLACDGVVDEDMGGVDGDVLCSGGGGNGVVEFDVPLDV